MSRDRDDQMRALLHSLTPPDHRPGFWDDVRAGLDEEAAGSSVVPLDRYRRHRSWFLAAAAIVLIGAIVGFGVLRDRSGDVGVTTDPDGENSTPDDSEAPPTALDDGEDSTSTTTPDDGAVGPLRPDGDPIDRGSGQVVGVSPDGQWLYVTDDAGTGDGGCEGTPQRALYVQPVGGGARTLAAPVDALDATTISELHFDGGGRVATVVQCEGFEARIVAASLGDDGTLTDVTELTLPEPECHDGTVDGITDIDYVARGELVAATSSFGEGGSVCRHLYSLPDAPSEPSLSDQEDVYLVETAAGGQIVTATVDGEIRLNGGLIHTTSGVSDIDVSPDGTVVAVAGTDESVVLPLDGGDPTQFAGAAYAVTLRDPRSGTMLVPAGDQAVLAALNLDGDDALTSLTDKNSSVTTFFSVDGSRLFLTVNDDGGNQRVIEQPVTG